jgi:hypothetical protein
MSEGEASRVVRGDGLGKGGFGRRREDWHCCTGINLALNYVWGSKP